MPCVTGCYDSNVSAQPWIDRVPVGVCMSTNQTSSSIIIIHSFLPYLSTTLSPPSLPTPKLRLCPEEKEISVARLYNVLIVCCHTRARTQPCSSPSSALGEMLVYCQLPTWRRKSLLGLCCKYGDRQETAHWFPLCVPQERLCGRGLRGCSGRAWTKNKVKSIWNWCNSVESLSSLILDILQTVF